MTEDQLVERFESTIKQTFDQEKDQKELQVGSNDNHIYQIVIQKMKEDNSALILSEISSLYCQELVYQTKLYFQLYSCLQAHQEIYDKFSRINDFNNYSETNNETTIELISLSVEFNDSQPEKNETLKDTPVAFLYCCDKYWGKVEVRNNSCNYTTIKYSPLNKIRLFQGFKNNTLKISFHIDSDEICYPSDSRFQDTPSDEDNSPSNRNSICESKSNFDLNPFQFASSLANIKEEEEDYEKDFLMLIGTSEVSLDQIVKFESANESICIQFPIITTQTVSPDEENLYMDSDDDGVGLGEPRVTTKSVIVGNATMRIKINYGTDFEKVLTTILNEERNKQSIKINTATKLTKEKQYIIEKAICWSRNFEFCQSLGIVKISTESEKLERSTLERKNNDEDTPRMRRFFLCASTRNSHNECCLIF